MGYGRLVVGYDAIKNLTLHNPELGLEKEELRFCAGCNPDLPERVRQLLNLSAEFKVHMGFYEPGSLSVCFIVEHSQIPSNMPGDPLPDIRLIWYLKYNPADNHVTLCLDSVRWDTPNGEVNIPIDTMDEWNRKTAYGTRPSIA